MAEKVAFYCRAKPQGCDAFEIFQKAKRAFIGYPLPRPGASYDPKNLTASFIHPMEEYSTWLNACKQHGMWRQSLTQNRNMVASVGVGSIVLIPRPQQGVVFAGRVRSAFKLEDDPPWANAYLQLRQSKGLANDDVHKWHIADVMQGWPVDEFRPLPLGVLPGWIKGSLFGRQTFGRIKNHPMDDRLTAHSFLDRLLCGESLVATNWTTDRQETKKRLVDELNPSSFENLMVSLMQLEHPGLVWRHVGGPGDGGVDCIGVGDDGAVHSLVQCKLQATAAPEFTETPAHSMHEQPLNKYVAILMPDHTKSVLANAELLNLDWITSAVIKHANRLPLAISLKIGVVDGRNDGRKIR